MRALTGARYTDVQALHIMNKDRYQSTSARRALALLNSPLALHITNKDQNNERPRTLALLNSPQTGSLVR